jgi:hypothetical protein
MREALWAFSGQLVRTAVVMMIAVMTAITAIPTALRIREGAGRTAILPQSTGS